MEVLLIHTLKYHNLLQKNIVSNRSIYIIFQQTETTSKVRPIKAFNFPNNLRHLKFYALFLISKDSIFYFFRESTLTKFSILLSKKEFFCNDLFSRFEQQILFLEKQAEATDPTTDHHGHDGPSQGLVSKHLEKLKIGY